MDTKRHIANSSEPLAIVGVAFKLPQDTIDATSFWDIMEKRKNMSADWPTHRLPSRRIHAVNQDPAVFDAPFFSITAKEASSMDPQQRWALQAAYHAFENAGIPVESLRSSRTGVFSATFADDFTKMMSKDPDTVPLQAAMGTTPSILPNRVSWYFDLRGPSMHIDTACSGSMVAMDMACQSIRTGNATAALVIGCNVMLSPDNSVLLGNMNFLSPDGRSFSFDNRANGYARGEGVVAVVIKPLADALENGDVIRAVVRSTASNHDGRTPILTQPSAEAQEALIRDAYAKAGLGFKLTRYVEAHGTGTPVGDPIELSAIGNVFGSSRSSEEPLFVGSVKANIGHLEGASGLAAVIKAILILEKGIIPPNALFEKLNPRIDADSHNIQIPTRSIPWPIDGPRRVSINSFGVGGANAHVILDDAFHYLEGQGLCGFHNTTARHTSQRSKQQASPRLLIWSASDAGAMERIGHAYQKYYCTHILHESVKLDQLAYTLATRRSIMPWRSFAVVDSEGAITPAVPVRVSSETNSIAFIFTGQGAQYAKMGLDLLQYDVFEASLRASDDAFASLGGEWSVQDVLRSEADIHLPQFSQPLCTALQIALVDLLRSFEVSPAAVVGHSSGEIAAAYAIGALSHQSACKIAYLRGQLAGELVATTATPGAMLSANLVESEVPTLLQKLSLTTRDTAVHVACVNSPINVTLSGPGESINLLQSYLDERDVFAKTVPTGVAYHSPAMRAVSTEYRALLGELQPAKILPSRESVMVSSVTGNTVDRKLLSEPDYWVQNLVSPVRFADAVQRLPGLHIKDLVEIGPHPALRRPLRDTVPLLKYYSILERSKSGILTLLSAIGSLFCHGHSPSVTAANMQASIKLPLLVDCPPYPFDQSRRYWSESRISRDYRLREAAPGYLLGRSAQDWNQLRPRWRNWLSLETHPWLGDHCVDGVPVYPGTGMVVMAIEALQRIAANGDSRITGYLVKRAKFLAPIVIGETSQQATETEIHVLPAGNIQGKNTYETRVFSYRNNTWIECFHAVVRVQYQQKTRDSVDGGHELQQAHEEASLRIQEAASVCKETLNPDSFYTFNKDHIGLHFKASFQNLATLNWNGHGTFSARVNVASASQHYNILNSPVHPAVLDSCVQPSLAHISRGLSQTICPTMMAQSVANLWISARVWDMATESVHVASFVNDLNDKSGQLQASAYGAADDGSILFSVEEMIMAEVSRPDVPVPEHAGPSLYQLAWKPQLSSIHGQELQAYFDASDSGAPDQTFLATLTTIVPKMEFALRTAAHKALRHVTPAEREQAPPHIERYALLLEQRYGDDKSMVDGDATDEEIDTYLEECEAVEPGFQMFPLVARALPSLLRGDTDPLELLFSSNAAEKFYDYLSRPFRPDHGLFSFIDLAAHERPSLRIIEIGAGTGAMTRPVIASLRCSEAKMGRYCFQEFMHTDVSPAFFEKARAEFVELDDRVLFKALDIERDVSSQGFELEGYDIVIAMNVFHATASLEKTLTNARGLLKPGGRLILHEAVVPDSACFNVGFGCLQGWHSGTEEWRQQGALATEQQWDRALCATGFSGIDASIWDYPIDACHMCSTLFSEAIQPAAHSVVDERTEAITWLLLDGSSGIQQSLASELCRCIPGTQVIHLTTVADGHATISPVDIVISLLEVGSPLLASISEADFAALKTLFSYTENLLWVTAARHRNDPHHTLAVGFLRTMRSEESGKHLVTLAFESPITGTDEASLMVELYQRCFAKQPLCSDDEFIVSQGRLTIGRLERGVSLQDKQLAATYPRRRKGKWESSWPLVLDIGTPGMLDTFRFVADTPCPALRPDEVEIIAAAWGVAFHDVLVALGRLSKEEELGLECAGTVVRVGSDATGFQPGDRVLMTTPGGMRSHPRAPGQLVYGMPNSLSFSEAVAILIPGMTAYHSLVNVARVRPGEKVLIHAAAGATGQMLVSVAQLLGAEVFATVGSAQKKDFLLERFQIPPEHVFYSRNTSFASGVKRVTKGHGVDVVVNSLSGEGLLASWECVAPYGHFIELGKADIQANSDLPMSGFANNISFTAVDVLHIVQSDHTLTRQLAEKAIALVAGGEIRGPAPIKLFGASQTEQAFRLMQSGSNVGRVVISLAPEEIVPIYTTLRAKWCFRPDASYLVAGGLGGIGRAILEWMVAKGARHLIVPSRSGASTEQAVGFIAGIISRGVRVVAPTCDVSSATDLAAMLQGCAITMPPVRGCINAAMVLQDAIFESMTHDQWSLSIQSKVNTSWNLHQLLPREMDFFILLSSVMGIYANPSQSNYAAGCVFQDSLARSRSAQGLGGSVSLDIGYMASVGYVAQSQSQTVLATARNLAPIKTTEFLEILGHYCDPALPLLNETQSELIIGGRTAEDYIARGEEPVPVMSRPLFAGFNGLRQQDARATRLEASEASPAMLFQQTGSIRERVNIVTGALRAKVARSLGVGVEDVDAEKMLSDYGTDSLMAIELRSWMRKDFGADVKVFDMLGSKSMKAAVYKALSSPLRRIPGPLHTTFTRLPLHFATLGGKQLYYIHELHQRYGPVVRISPAEVSVSSLAGVREIHRIGSGFLKAEWYEKLTPDRVGIFAMRDAKQHAQRRKLFARMFSKSELRASWEPLVREKVLLFVSQIQEELQRTGVCDVLKWSTFLATDVSGHLMFGESFDMLRLGKKNEYIEVLELALKGSGIGLEMPLLRAIGSRVPLKSFQTLFNSSKFLNSYAQRAVKNSRKNSDSSRNIFSDIIYESEKKESALTDVDVANEAGNLIVAGSDTTAVTLTYLIWALLSHPKLRTLLEIELAGLSADFDQAALESLPLLNAAIMETLRLYGAAPGSLPRTVPEGGATLSDHYIPAGTTVSTQSWTIHRDEALFPQAEKFDPLRWLPGDNQVTDQARMAFAPFGTGSRTCLGIHLSWMELRLAVAEFFLRCKNVQLAPSATSDCMKPEHYFLIAPQGHKCEVMIK
ncbi:hypothetical protein BJX99DRAFT_260932 [Aspergillus californicus]